jgi:hypothetical protein
VQRLAWGWLSCAFKAAGHSLSAGIGDAKVTVAAAKRVKKLVNRILVRLKGNDYEVFGNCNLLRDRETKLKKERWQEPFCTQLGSAVLIYHCNITLLKSWPLPSSPLG